MILARSNSYLDYVRGMVYDLSAPSSINYFWGFGVILGCILVLQLITGLVLACWYVPSILKAFDSVEHIKSDVSFGWLFRYLHSNGASMFFLFIYLHVASGIFYGSYLAPSQALWLVGVLIYLVLKIAAFLGYVLPWGQKSLWGATVITSMLGAVPTVGLELVVWLWGGFAVGEATLNSFFVLHFVLPFVLLVLVVLHLDLLHFSGSSTPLGVVDYGDTLLFHPSFTWNDMVGLIWVGAVYMCLVCYYPLALGHSDNYLNGDPLVTPLHISPEWYYLFAYAILSAVPDNLKGVLAMLCSVLVLLSLSYTHWSVVRSASFNPYSSVLFWTLIGFKVCLTLLGASVAEYPFVFSSQVLSLCYFLNLTVLSCFGYIFV